MDKDFTCEPMEPIDFSALDPTLDASFDSRVAALLHAALPPRVDVLTQLVSWARPALAASAVIAAAAAIALFRTAAPNPPQSRGASAADILGIPAPVARLARAQSVDVVDLAEAFGVEQRHGR